MSGDIHQIMSQNQNGMLNAGDNFGIGRSFMGLHIGDHCEKETNVLGIFFILGRTR